LTPILFVSSILGQDPTVPDHIREELNTIARNAGLEARLIDDLLDVTRISQGKLSLTFETVDAHELLHSALGICSNEISAKNLRVQVRLEAIGHRIRADAARLQQVFWNLIKNATCVRAILRAAGFGWRLLTVELESLRTFSRESSIHLSKAAAPAPAVWGWD
jgi:signal transduction histidine kinase